MAEEGFISLANDSPVIVDGSQDSDKLSRQSSFAKQSSFISLDIDGGSSKTAETPSKSSTKKRKRDARSGRSPLVQLHHEILEFCERVAPTEIERKLRQEVVADITSAVHNLWPRAEVKVFGSQFTELYLPNSDVDMVVFGAEPKGSQKFSHMQELSAELSDLKMISYIEEIKSAKVPIIKLKHAETGIPVDICFDQESGKETGNIMKQFLHQMAPLRPLVLVMKFFLLQRSLNETYTGGIGSFMLQMMIVSMLQHHQRRRGRMGPGQPRAGLGLLLLEFFHLYGISFNYVAVGISVRDGGFYFPKSLRGWSSPDRPAMLCVENPADTGRDIGTSSYAIGRIRQAFAHAAISLEAAMQLGGSQNGDDAFPMLGTILSMGTLVGRQEDSASEEDEEEEKETRDIRELREPRELRELRSPKRKRKKLSQPVASVSDDSDDGGRTSMFSKRSSSDKAARLASAGAGPGASVSEAIDLDDGGRGRDGRVEVIDVERGGEEEEEEGKEEEEEEEVGNGAAQVGEITCDGSELDEKTLKKIAKIRERRRRKRKRKQERLNAQKEEQRQQHS